jgi:hypothetical protein
LLAGVVGSVRCGGVFSTRTSGWLLVAWRRRGPRSARSAVAVPSRGSLKAGS